MEKLENKSLGISEDDIANETDLEILLHWKNQIKKEVNRMQGKVEIAMEKDGIENTGMKRAIKCQELMIEIIIDRITIIK